VDPLTPLKILVVLLSVTVHEAMHAWTAKRMGDPTAEAAGRMTLNPLPHIDPIGSVLVPALLLLTKSPFLIAWAKPVPVNPYNFRNPRRGNLWVSLGGPASNLGLAFFSAAVFRLLPAGGAHDRAVVLNAIFGDHTEPFTGLQILLAIAALAVIVNVALAIFNMIPIPPLDGSGVLMGLLPEKAAAAYASIAPYGFVIMILLLATGIVGTLVYVPLFLMLRLLLGLG
jgi:Zn-dependent protease